MAVSLDSFMPDILDDIPHVPVMTAERMLVRAAREFCKETRLWRAEINVPILTPNQRIYSIATGVTDAQVFGIYEAYLDGRQLALRSEVELDARADGIDYSPHQVTDYRNASGGACSLMQIERDKFRVIRIPDDVVDQKFELIVYQIPTTNATTLPDRLFDEHLEAMSCGAKWLLMRMQDKPWTNPNMASYYQNQFDTAKHAEILHQIRKNSNRGLSIRKRPFI